MFIIDALTQGVADLEATQATAAEIDNLIYRICSEPWATSEEREKAQALVRRLETLKHRQDPQ